MRERERKIDRQREKERERETEKQREIESGESFQWTICISAVLCRELRLLRR